MFRRSGDLFKVLIIGNSSVGKTAVLLRYVQGSFGKHRATIGADILVKTVYVDNREINLQIWDTSGDEKYKSVTQFYYRGADACVMVFDVSNIESFTSLQYWMQEIIQNVSPPDPENFPFIVLANKVDVENRVVTERMAEKWAEQYNMPYVEVSAKDNINIDFAFKLLATNILKNSDNDDNLQEDNTGQFTIIPKPIENLGKPCC